MRMHSRCVFGDVFGSTSASARDWCRTRCAPSPRTGQGVLVYLHETGPGFRIERDDAGRRGCSATGAISCTTRAKTASGSCSTSTGSARRFSPIWGCTRSGLLTNHPRKIVALEGFGIEVVDQLPVGH